MEVDVQAKPAGLFKPYTCFVLSYGDFTVCALLSFQVHCFAHCTVCIASRSWCCCLGGSSMLDDVVNTEVSSYLTDTDGLSILYLWVCSIDGMCTKPSGSKLTRMREAWTSSPKVPLFALYCLRSGDCILFATGSDLVLKKFSAVTSMLVAIAHCSLLCIIS